MTGERTIEATAEATEPRHEAAPKNALVKAIQRKLHVVGASIAEARLGGDTLRLVQGREGQIPQFEYWYRLNSQEHVYVNSYDIEEASWWLMSWERPQAESIPLHLRDRVDVGWRVVNSRFSDPHNAPPYPYEGQMEDYLSTLSWRPADDVPPPFDGFTRK